MGEWDVSLVPDFSWLFIKDEDLNRVITGADSFNEPLDWNTGT